MPLSTVPRAWRLAGLVLLLGAAAWAQPSKIPTAAITATASSEFYPPLTAASLTIDESGLTGDLHDNHPQGHTMWLSASGGAGSAANNPAGLAGTAWLLYQFNQPYLLDSLWIWNHNQENLTDRGLRRISIHTSLSGTTWTLITQTELTRAPGTPDYAHDDEIALGQTNVRYVLLTANETEGNYGSAYYGLSEIRFYGESLPCIPPDYPVQLVSVEVDPVYADMLTPQASGWIGSDVAHSIPLPNGTSVWLFGDTLVGTVTNGKRDGGAAFINNSIGIQNRTAIPPTQVDFYWGSGPSSFFPHQPGTPGDYYWPTMGTLLGDELFVFCYSVGPGTGGLGFQLENTTLLRIPNPLDPPGSWTVNAYDLGIDNSIRGFHSAVIVEEPYLYLMGYDGAGNMALARSLTADLLAGGLSETFQYWTQGPTGPQWSSTPDNLVPLFAPRNTETDIHYEPAWGRYFVTTYNPFTPTIYLTTAESLTGPWTEPVCIYEIPEHDIVSFSVISYAVRPHPELSTQPGELVISYATNTLDGLAPLFTQEGLGIYHPRFIRVQLALNEPPSNVSGFWLY